nr:hypothetical protein [Shewanella sp. SR44-3]
MMDKMNLAISVEKLASLIKAGHLCAADLQCLDKQTKQRLWQLCLWCCDKRAVCTQAACKTGRNSSQSCLGMDCQGTIQPKEQSSEAELIYTREG